MTKSARISSTFILGLLAVAACTSEPSPASRPGALVPQGGGSGTPARGPTGVGGAGATPSALPGGGGSTGVGAGADTTAGGSPQLAAGQAGAQLSIGGSAGSAPGGGAGGGAAGDSSQGGATSAGTGGQGAAGQAAAGGGGQTAAGGGGQTAVGGGGQTAAAGTGGAQEPPLPATCPAGRGPTMIAMTIPGLPSYCIDTTEVTQGQYAAFLADQTVSVDGQSRAICKTYNRSFVPTVSDGHQQKGCPEGTYSPETKGNLAVDCVDFCDAVAYCEWAGKRLCGSVDGGPMAQNAPASSDRGQWFAACSHGGATKYPYGNTFEAGKCDTGGKYVGTKPASESTCRASTPPYDQLADLSGGVFEWEDSCVDEATCRIRGGASATLEEWAFECGSEGVMTAWDSTSQAVGVGIRCCSDGVK